jgi:hypothetical protein
MFVLTSADITGIGAQVALQLFNIDSLCGIGRSTKKGRRDQGFIGKKGRVIKDNRSRLSL